MNNPLFTLTTALLSLAAGAAQEINRAQTVAGLWAKPPQEAWKAELLKQPIRAFCVDFNWQIRGNDCWFAAPGHWADADPAAQVKWCKEAGVNCIQTFVLSCNGYAWYKGGPVPEQPGLTSDFLTEVVRQGHQQKMLVMGYYCIGANTLWGQRHPDQSYGTPTGSMHIPFTKDYIAYLCASVEDALKRTGMDGFMLDWMSNTSGKWLDCEKAMYAEYEFKGVDRMTINDWNIAALVRFHTGREVKPKLQTTSLVTGKPATASSVWSDGYEAENAFDGDSSTRWGAAPNSHNAWLEVDLGKPARIRRAVIENAYPELKRIRKFAIETWQDGQWKPCYQGENLDAKLDITIDPVTASRVRLNITEATDTPTLWEFQLYE